MSARELAFCVKDSDFYSLANVLTSASFVVSIKGESKMLKEDSLHVSSVFRTCLTSIPITSPYNNVTIAYYSC
jgi:hypothetical protein